MAEPQRGDGTGPARSTRRGDIQGLRAVAVLLVVVYHSGVALPGGFIGVDVFFVISGYVITKMLTVELAATGRIDLRRFYLRRIRRLLPALGLMLSVVMLAAVLLESIGGQQVTARTGAAAALLNANTYLIRFGEGGYFDVGAEVNALLHTWSLSVEEQFYLAFPAVVLGAWSLGRRLPRLGSAGAAAVVLAGITTVSFVLSWLLTSHPTAIPGLASRAAQIAFYSAPTRAWQFASGALLAYAAARLVDLGRVVGAASTAIGATLVLLAAVTFDEHTAFPGTAALVPTFGTVLILLGGARPGANPLNMALAVRPAQLLGDISYSWYLWHWPCIVFAAALWPSAEHAGLYAAAFSLLPAWLAYRLVENPIRFASKPSSLRTLALAAGCVALPLASAVVLEAGNRTLRQSDTLADYEEPFVHHADWLGGCDQAHFVERKETRCAWIVDDPIGVAVLIGDSNAGHFTEAFTAAANNLGMTATVTTSSACPFIDLVPVDGDDERSSGCQRFVTATLDALVEYRPSLVVLASSETYIESDRWALEAPDGGDQFTSASAKAAVWRDGLTRTISKLQAYGIEVVIVHPIPKAYGWDPRQCAVARILLAPGTCGTSWQLADANKTRARQMSAESAAAAATNIRTLDVARLLCPDGTCSTRQGGTWTYRDGGHISVAAAAWLTPEFERLLAPSSR